MAFSVDVALGDGVIRDGLGAISSGRGGTNIAHCDNGEILLDNPAGMVNIKRRRMAELSADLLLCDLHYADLQDDTDAVSKLFPLGQLSYMIRSPDGQWALGVGVFGPAGFGGEFHLTNPIVGSHRYKSFGALAKVLPGVAYRLTDRLSVGATFGVGISHAELEGPFFLQTGPLQGVPTVLYLDASGATPVWSTGLQYQLSERTMVGVTYQSESRFCLRGNMSADVYLPGPTIVSSDFDVRMNLTWPRSVGLGIKHDLSPRQRVSADVIWFDWPHAFDTLGLELSNASNPLIPGLVGPTIHDDFPLDWRDSVSMRLGYERFFDRSRVLRAGYVFHRNPIPDATLTPYIPAILEHAFSIGWGRRWGDCNLDLAYQFSFGPDRNVTASSIVGGDFDSSRVTARAHWVFLSFSKQF